MSLAARNRVMDANDTDNLENVFALRQAPRGGASEKGEEISRTSACDGPTNSP